MVLRIVYKTHPNSTGNNALNGHLFPNNVMEVQKENAYSSFLQIRYMGSHHVFVDIGTLYVTFKQTFYI